MSPEIIAAIIGATATIVAAIIALMKTEKKDESDSRGIPSKELKGTTPKLQTTALNNVEKTAPFKPASLDEAIIEVEKMAMSYVVISSTGLQYTIHTWIGSTDQIYKCPSIQNLKKLAVADLINDLQKRYVTKETYPDKVPILLILLGLLDGQLPYSPSGIMDDKKIDANARYLRKIGVIEIAPLKEIVVFLHAVSNECYL